MERGKRVFPVSDRSLDVVLALEKYLKKNGVKLHLESPVEGILIADGRAEGIRLKNGKEERADGVIVCTGGLSYPGTGSTGDGYRFAKAAGHHVTKLYPSLVPLRTEEDWCHELWGLSLKNIEITIKNKKGKKVYSDFGGNAVYAFRRFRSCDSECEQAYHSDDRGRISALHRPQACDG